ncbi:hypothetical protein BDN70DRAFT_993740 [Pholiota conissans]|uniref:Uncharacterized protein n=1 Tax=Pholiota conissans TaxID=109636 RepID=A0A9P5Z408_9AGAR|nr:hypothetical protein BDN70DRAFT_993740 [Pholiota conissans]
MTNFSCSAFSSINDALTQANVGNLNVTTYVGSCPQVCTLPWGTGYQILPGIGVNVSYILQATLTFIFGPLFCVVYGLRNRWNIATFIDTATLFSITVAAAAVARFRQHAQIYELTFLRTLTTTQFLSLLSSIVASGVFEERISELCITVLVLYGLLNFGLYVGFIRSLHTSHTGWQTLIDLERACADNGHPKLSLLHIIAAKANSSTPEASVNLSSLNSLTGWKAQLTVFGLTIAGILLMVIVLVVLLVLVAAMVLILKVLASKDAGPLAFVSFGLAIGMLVELVLTVKARDAMIALTEARHEEKEWGFD